MHAQVLMSRMEEMANVRGVLTGKTGAARFVALALRFGGIFQIVRPCLRTSRQPWRTLESTVASLPASCQ
jgi:hypothetical protein